METQENPEVSIHCGKILTFATQDKAMSASSKHRPPANKHDGHNCESNSNTKSQNALYRTSKASPRLSELIRQTRLQMRQKADNT
ncbi:hypothetical protein GJ496_005488 [Pomphorhynchus laevis]|nr:hypothetical protein GJ496_005488 [Pomphorhynchus laevis]